MPWDVLRRLGSLSDCCRLFSPCPTVMRAWCFFFSNNKLDSLRVWPEVSQVCLLSQILVSIYGTEILGGTKWQAYSLLVVSGSHLVFAGDVVLLASSPDDLQLALGPFKAVFPVGKEWKSFWLKCSLVFSINVSIWVLPTLCNWEKKMYIYIFQYDKNKHIKETFNADGQNGNSRRFKHSMFCWKLSWKLVFGSFNSMCNIKCFDLSLCSSLAALFASAAITITHLGPPWRPGLKY